MSLGIICNQKYNPISHVGQDIFRDPLDQQMYARNSIAWFVKEVRRFCFLSSRFLLIRIVKGESVETEYVSRPFYRNMNPKMREAWIDKIAISYLQKEKLPKHMREGSWVSGVAIAQ